MWSLWGLRGGSGGRARLDKPLPPAEEVGKTKGSQSRRGGEGGGLERRRRFGTVTTAAGATVCATGGAGGNDHECRVPVSHGCG